MAETAKQIKVVEDDSSEKHGPAGIFSEKESHEIVIGFAGPVGCGMKGVVAATEQKAREFGYTVVPIKISELIKKIGDSDKAIDIGFDPSKKSERYLTLQQAGNDLRKKYSTAILAQCAATNIATIREVKKGEISGGDKSVDTPKIAYLVDQLKHPDEIDYLRMIYRNLFYLVGVLSCETKRKKRLTDNGISDKDAALIMDHDRGQDFQHGQKLEDTLQLSDLFLRNSSHNIKGVEKQILRFLELVHGKVGITPSKHEYAMYIAHAAAQKSACLSRQVGAAITDEKGNIISTGCNDVPKFGGGLYTEAQMSGDYRCVNLTDQCCYNDRHKDLLCEEIKKILVDSGTKVGEAAELANKIRRTTKLKDLIEYSRSVHAEMDAITSAARKGSLSTLDGYLYTTTFPCHSCARHIISAGINRVYYIEPYEKSLAWDLHDDAIVIDPEKEDDETNKVTFLHFEGISPRKYLAFFHTGVDRKSDGKALKFYQDTASKVVVQYTKSYFEFELKAVEDVDKLGLRGIITSG